MGTENLAHRQGRHSIFSGPPRGIGHLVSETFSGGDRALGDEGERDGGCIPRGDWEVMVGGRPNPEASVALRGPSRVRSPQWDCVVPPTQFPSVFWPQALGCKWGREGSSSVRRERRQEGRQVWLREIPDFHLLCNTVFLAKPSSRAAGDPEQAELVVGPGHSADVWGVLSSEEGPVSQV